MEELPWEIVEMILSQIPTEELVTTFRAVSKQYFQVAQSLVTSLSFSTFRFARNNHDRNLMTVARDYPLLTHLDMTGSFPLSNTGHKIIYGQMTQLKSLKMTSMSKLTSNFFLKCRLTNLKTLDLQQMGNEYGGYKLLFEGYDRPKFVAANVFPNLEDLKIHRNVTQGDFQPVLESLPKLKTLRIELCSAPVIIDKAPSLRELILEQYMGFTIFIYNNPNIEVIDIRSKFRDWNTFKWTFLKKCPNLRVLKAGSVETPEISSGGLVELLTTSNSKLEVLHLHGLIKEPEELEQLVLCLTELKELNIWHRSQLRNSRMQSTIESIKKNFPKLKLNSAWPKIIVDPVIDAPEKDDTPTKCLFCSQTMTVSDIKDHEEVCLKWPGHYCPLRAQGCTAEKMTKNEVRNHIHKCPLWVYKCAACSESVRRPEREEHEKRHEKTYSFALRSVYHYCPFLIDECPALFDNSGDYFDHLGKCSHYSCYCPSCRKEFTSRDAAEKHLFSEECQGPRRLEETKILFDTLIKPE
eukprot:TRINITY_DN2730_c0_g1_i1.p1 TRINITY_DN2730_c0_g1~~TRINITY_DN2730_c0_g1_i1.p1  ORF type:complete len:523 (-),score=23.08 TRINITY_DN2730_c0_g1_i1:47-1615(-)